MNFLHLIGYVNISTVAEPGTGGGRLAFYTPLKVTQRPVSETKLVVGALRSFPQVLSAQVAGSRYSGAPYLIAH